MVRMEDCDWLVVSTNQRSLSVQLTNEKPYLVNDGGLKVHKHGPGHVLAGPGLGEKGVKGVISAPGCLIRWHGAIRLDAYQYIG